MEIMVREVSSKKDFETFITFPNCLYARNPYWVPPLLADEKATLSPNKNPAFEYCEATYWLAYIDSKPVGRIAGIINHAFIAKSGDRYARFGWFDFIDDSDVCKALLNALEGWALKKGMIAVHGPLGFTDFDAEGMLVDGFDKLGTMTTLYNFPYYPRYLEKFHYKKDVDWIEFEVLIPAVIPARVVKLADAATAKYNLQILDVRRSRELLPYASGLFGLINQSFANLYGVVPLSAKQIEAYTNQYFSFISPSYVSLVLRQGSVVAFAIAIPSLSKALQKAKGKLFPAGIFYLYHALKQNTVADLYLIGIHPQLQGKGITALLIQDLSKKLRKKNIATAITHPILENNSRMISFWKDYENRFYKRRRCYIKFLNM
jgi:GNAT superfamily N-acetyltransferase